MHILWLVRTTLPQAAAACGLAGASDVSGSWLTGQLAALRACPDLQLTVLCVGKEAPVRWALMSKMAIHRNISPSRASRSLSRS